MRINDGSICHDCKHFEHECDYDYGCMESCHCNNEDIRERFYDDEEEILECVCFEED